MNSVIGSASTFTSPDPYPDLLNISNPTYTTWNGQTAYIGFSFTNDGNVHYGWLKATVTASGDTFTVLDGAYNTEPDASILAGDCSGGNNVISINFNSSNILCNGDNSGAATAIPVGGVAPYAFLWSNGNSSATANNLVAGTYSVTATDNNGNTGSGSVAITEPLAINLSIFNN